MIHISCLVPICSSRTDRCKDEFIRRGKNLPYFCLLGILYSTLRSDVKRRCMQMRSFLSSCKFFYDVCLSVSNISDTTLIDCVGMFWRKHYAPVYCISRIVNDFFLDNTFHDTKRQFLFVYAFEMPSAKSPSDFDCTAFSQEPLTEELKCGITFLPLPKKPCP